MSGPSTLWDFEVSSPSAPLLPQQPCAASASSKERQTLHGVSELGYQQGPSPHGDILHPWEVQTQAGGIFHVDSGRCPKSSFSEVMEHTKRMVPEL